MLPIASIPLHESTNQASPPLHSIQSQPSAARTVPNLHLHSAPVRPPISPHPCLILLNGHCAKQTPLSYPSPPSYLSGVPFYEKCILFPTYTLPALPLFPLPPFSTQNANLFPIPSRKDSPPTSLLSPSYFPEKRKKKSS